MLPEEAKKLNLSSSEAKQLKAKNHNSKFKAYLILSFALWFCLFRFTLYVFAASGPARYRVFSLRHISAEQGKKYLAEVNIGTVSQLPKGNTLLVTAQPAELIKASAILKLVDTTEQFVIRTIFPASAAKDLPSNDQIASEVGNMSIGTFSNPPADIAGVRAIIDIHNDSIIAVAPAAHLEKIIEAVERLQDREPSHEPQDTNESNELLSELLGSLAEAEKTAAESRQVGTEPNEPAKPAVVVRGSEAEKPGPEPKPERMQPAVETEQPGEGVEPAPRGPGLREPPKVWSYEPEPIANGDEILKLDLPEKLTIIQFLDFVGEYLGLTYLYNAEKLKGDVTLKPGGKLRGPIKVKELYPLLESVLKFKGFAMSRRGNLVTIVPADEATGIDPLLHPEAGEVQLGDVVITRVFKLKHINTTSAENLLKGMKLGADISPIQETGTLIITEYAYRMGRIEELLEMIDQPGEPKKFRFRQLKYTMATTLAPKIKTLAEELGTISITIAAPSEPPSKKPPVRGRPSSRPPTPAPAPAKPTVYLDADERTNRILMIGLQEQLTTVDELIDTLDVAQQDLRTLRLYEIQHVGAEEVKKKLEELGIIGEVRRDTTTPRPSIPSRTKK